MPSWSFRSSLCDFFIDLILQTNFPTVLDIISDIFMNEDNNFDDMTTRKTTFYIIITRANNPLILNVECIMINSPVWSFVADRHWQTFDKVFENSLENCFTNNVTKKFQLIPLEIIFVSNFAELILLTFLGKQFGNIEKLNDKSDTFLRTTLNGYSLEMCVLMQSLTFSPNEVEMEMPWKH